MSTSSRSSNERSGPHAEQGLGKGPDQGLGKGPDKGADKGADNVANPDADRGSGPHRSDAGPGIEPELTWPRIDVMRWDLPPDGATAEYLLAAFPAVGEALVGRTRVGMILGLQRIGIPRPAAREVFREQMRTLSPHLRGVAVLVNPNPLAGLLSGIGVFLMGNIPVSMSVARDESKALRWLKAGGSAGEGVAS